MAGFNISDNLIVKNGSLGIGTSSPATKLETNGDIGIGRVAGGYTFREVVGGGERASMKSNASNELLFSIGASTEATRIDSSGNVLVGKTTAGQLGTAGIELRPNNLYVTSNSGVPIYANRNTNDGDIIQFRKDNSTVGSVATYSGTVQFGQGNVNLKFSNAADAITPANGSGTNNSNALDLGSTSAKFKDGYFGGTVTADELVVDAAGGNGKLVLENAGTPRGCYIGVEGYDDLVLAADEDNLGTDSAMKFRVDASEAMRIDSSGNVGIGNTSPNYKLDINGDVNIASGSLLRWGSGDVEITNSSYNLLFKTYDGVSSLVERMRIDSSGNVLVGKTAASTNTVGVEARPDGTFAAVKSNGGAAVFGRNGNDGTTVTFRKDGSTVGSIGNNTDFYIASQDGTGVRFTSTQVLPCSESGALQNGSRDLGSTSAKFKDAHFSGSIVTSEVSMSGGAPQIKFNDTTSSANDFWVHVNNNNFYVLTDRTGNGAWDGANPLLLQNSDSNAYVYGNKVWNAGNDGSGSGLDADTVDGFQASSFLREAAMSTSANGYIKLSNGLIIQWGEVTNTGSYSTGHSITFPIAFPNACLNMQNTAHRNGASSTASLNLSIIKSYNSTGAQIGRDPGSRWMAIGY